MTNSAELGGQAGRWAGQRDRRRAEFVEAALRVIAEQGPAASLEAIAADAGVARTRVYRHFTDRADLERAISARVAELLVAELDPLWHPAGSARQMIRAAVGAHVRWLAANRNLWSYLVRHVRAEDDASTPESYPGVRRAVADHLARLFGAYLALVGVQETTTDHLAYAVVGMVESVSERWAEQGGDAEPVIAQLTDWTWAMMAAALAAVDVELDPDEPLPPLTEL